MRDKFISRAEGVVEALLESSPGMAQAAGDRRFDDRLPDFSSASVAAQSAMLREASHVLAEVDPEELAVDDAVDLEILLNVVESRRFAFAETRDFEWDPMVFNPGMLLHSLLTRSSAPAQERLHSLTARLTAIPDTLATARHQLRDVPQVHAHTAVQQFLGVAKLITTQTPQLSAQAPQLEAEVTSAAQQAARACREFSHWLAELPPGRSPRLGRKLWEAKLWFTLDTPTSAAKLLDRAWARLTDIEDQLHACAAELVGKPASPQTTAEALHRLAADRPDNDTIVPAAREAAAAAADFVVAHDLVAMPDEPLEIIAMPEFARGVAVAYCDPPGVLEPSTTPTFFAISPTPADWSPAQTDSFFAEYNHHLLRNLTVHEAIPGHYLQLAHARRRRGETRVRAVASSSAFVEGWAVYAEELMAEHGFGGLEVRVQQLKMQLRTTVNAIIDQLVHCEDMSEADALELMTQRGFQSEGEAAGKWRRALLSSTQLSTYFVGYEEVSRIAAAAPGGRPDRAWHDRMLAHASPPPRHLRTLLGV